MKIIRIFAVLCCFCPVVSFGVGSGDFQNASQLLMAARRGDVQTVQFLINSGADINYTDSTGLSLVCTAMMNNDKRAIQILQMYGADASKCDKQIKQYRQKSKVAAKGEEYNFFSGLSSSHIIALSAVAVAGVIGGVALLTDGFKAKNSNSHSSSGGSHSGGGGESGGGDSVTKEFTVPYGPAYLTTDGTIDTNFDLSQNLNTWGSDSASDLRKADFNYLRNTVVLENTKISPATAEGLNPMLQNYLLVMRGYYPLASGYMGQSIFRNSNKEPELPKSKDKDGNPLNGMPVRVALITGNSINPAGSADSAQGIMYAVNNTETSATPIVDKYINNDLKFTDSTLTEYTETENSGYDFSGSGSAFNPFADVNDSALAKIVAGWEGNDRTYADLYGFVPNAQLAIYRTGNGKSWKTIDSWDTKDGVGVFTDNNGDGVLSFIENKTKDKISINGKEYEIVSALSNTTITNPTLTLQNSASQDVVYRLSSNSKVFIGKCVDTTNCRDIALYVGTDGAWYVNSLGGDDIDSVYMLSEKNPDTGNNIYSYKSLPSSSDSIIYNNFDAIVAAVGNSSTPDVIANTNVIPTSRNGDYINVKTFTKAAAISGAKILTDFYSASINNYYGGNQGSTTNNLFNNYNIKKPMLIMPAGDYIFVDKTGSIVNYDTLDATFENYAPMLYGNNLKHNFMTVVAVNYSSGTSDVTSASGVISGKVGLSEWLNTDNNRYVSRKCGIAGVGNVASGIDPWCFAASGPTAEMATASAAGAVAAVKSAFDYMSNDQIFTLLALTADGPWLHADTSGTVFSTDSLVSYLQSMYNLPLEYDISNVSSSEYLDMFKDVYGYGLINLERAIKPGYSVYYYNGNTGSIVSTTGDANKVWGDISSSSSSSSGRSSRALSLSGRNSITISYYDIIESADGNLSLPRVWTNTISLKDNTSKHGLYMGDVLGEFEIDSTNKHTNQIGNLRFDMSMSDRAYNDNLNGLDNLSITFTNDKFDFNANYQHYLTDGQSRFNGRANSLLSLASNTVSSGAVYKFGNFGFGSRAFFGNITDESLLESDPAISSQFEPGRLGFVNGVSFDTRYNNDKIGLDLSFGTMHENNTVLGAISSGLLSLNGADTQYMDAVAVYNPTENVKLSLRGTFANTKANVDGGIISEFSSIKSNAFAFGVDVGGFSFTAAMPLATVSGRMGYGYADFNVVENNGKYSVVMGNAHTEYIDLSQNKRELRFTTNYKKSVGKFTDAGLGFIYRINPNNTDTFGNESVFMFKIHHRMGI